MRLILDIPIWALFIDGILHALLFAFLGILLWNAIQYGIFNSLSDIQKIINYTAIAILTVSIWLGVGFLLDVALLGKEDIIQITLVLPLRGLLGILLYSVLVLAFKINKDSKYSEEIILDEKYNQQENQHIEAPKTELLERISVKEGQKLHIINLHEIIYLQADGDYVQIITEKGKHLKEQTMKSLELSLPGDQFVRIHRSYIINVAYISRIEQYGKQNQLITLKNGSALKASLTGYRCLKNVLNL
jgi:hypothetical protein